MGYHDSMSGLSVVDEVYSMPETFVNGPSSVD